MVCGLVGVASPSSQVVRFPVDAAEQTARTLERIALIVWCFVMLVAAGSGLECAVCSVQCAVYAMRAGGRAKSHGRLSLTQRRGEAGNGAKRRGSQK